MVSLGIGQTVSDIQEIAGGNYKIILASGAEFIVSRVGGRFVTKVGGKIVTWTKKQWDKVRHGKKPDADGTHRPTWRESEIDEARLHGNEAREQVSYKDGQEVPNGTKGSVKPDIVVGDKAIEVKNYKVENSSNMVNTIVKQVKQRDCHLPGCMQQEIVIDFRGQQTTALQREQIRQSIVDKTNGIIGADRVRFK